ncbi:hypothetical protein CF326_g10056 [Tilletia indica]|nr:hypothetical protein CF326_g10056 [Tilletia indica]
MSTPSNTTIGDEDNTSTADAENHHHTHGRSSTSTLTLRFGPILIPSKLFIDAIPVASLSAEPAPPPTVADRRRKRFASTRTHAKNSTGSVEVLTWPSVSGLPSVRTPRPMATPGLTSRTSTPAVVPFAAVTTALLGKSSSLPNPPVHPN